jgi:putative RecB family exonuclease
MRLVYTAMTRTRSRVVWTATTAGIDESHRRPSRFIAAVAGDELAITQPQRRLDRPVTPQEAEAWLRTIVTDPLEPDARRLAAAHVLCTNSHPRMRSAESFTMIRERGPDTGLVSHGAAFSPSQAESFDSCPRRYALERRLHIGDPPSYYMAFGSMVHKVLELAELDALKSDRRSTLDEALAYLETEFGSYDFGMGSWRDAWHRRATQLLTQLYDEWPHPDASPVLLEHPLTLDIDGTSWRGIADRIERGADENLRIVDYKTSKNPPPKVESAKSIQLGFYLLAATFDDAVGSIGRPTAAEYWHPLATSQTRRVTPFDPENIEAVRERLIAIADGIRSEDWTPTPSASCRMCSVRIVCPSWPEGQEAFVR